jgi:hypothetical protein
MLGFRGASRYYDPRYRDGFAQPSIQGGPPPMLPDVLRICIVSAVPMT